jgi:hypothetical protein
VTEPWAVGGDARSVTAWSLRRLAFEPRGEMLEFRRALRAALKALEPVTGTGLVAIYLSPNDEFVDVENVALYNIGAGAYGHLTAAGLYCERLASPDDRHHLRYRVDLLPSPPASRLLARATATVPADAHAPGPWWAQFRPGVEVVDFEGLENGAFTVDVSILGPPAGTRVAGVVKPMLDGLVSALHRHDGRGRDDLLPRLSHLGDPEALWTALCAPAAAVLGTRRLVRVHGANIAWNPADERCNAFRVRVVPGSSRGVTAQVCAL